MACIILREADFRFDFGLSRKGAKAQSEGKQCPWHGVPKKKTGGGGVAQGCVELPGVA